MLFRRLDLIRNFIPEQIGSLNGTGFVLLLFLSDFLKVSCESFHFWVLLLTSIPLMPLKFPPNESCRFSQTA